MASDTNDKKGWQRPRSTWIGVVVVMVTLMGLFAKQAWTRFANMATYAKTAEAVEILEQIQQAQIAYFDTHGEYLAVGATPHRAPGRTQTVFESEHMDGWKRLGWLPDSKVRCQYEVTVPTATNFRAVARCDADGDGEMSVFVGSREGPPKRISPDEQH